MILRYRHMKSKYSFTAQNAKDSSDKQKAKSHRLSVDSTISFSLSEQGLDVFVNN